MRILGHTQTAEEVLAEVYEEVSRRAARFSKQNKRPLTWLILIAHRRAIERLCGQLTAESVASYKRRGGGAPKSTPSHGAASRAAAGPLLPPCPSHHLHCPTARRCRRRPSTSSTTRERCWDDYPDTDNVPAASRIFTDTFPLRRCA